MNTTFERLSAVLIQTYHFEPELLTLDAPLEALGIDSLGLADMLFNIEDAFHITLPAQPVDLLTLGDVVQFIDQLIGAQNCEAASPTTSVAPLLHTA
ncbi:acyl carrier protein [Rhodoferax sp.]|uniref:acyl carrier protein n=1 Tax=Rhodoferax sp. TaxID=50421 RepID=UPI00274E2CF3|nr:acyl carrier protein [Rhodoferax sp.]